jgi:hypothetical protein
VNGTERDCVTCGTRFTGRYRRCPGCRPYRTERLCAECGSSFRGETLKCSACQATERQCIICGTTFASRYQQCDPCRRPPVPCLVRGCTNPKVPGQGSKVCRQHRDDANDRKLARLRELGRLTNGICQMPGCTEPKLQGQGQKYCTRHSAEGPQRERAQIVRRRREREYGLTHDEFLALLDAQGGVCAICGNGEQRRALAVDHDHETGAVRGLLCDRCNPMLGYARDNAAVLQAAIAYLAKTSA